MLGLVRLGQIKLVHLGFRKVKKKVAQMGCRAIEKSRKWDVAQLESRANGMSRI